VVRVERYEYPDARLIDRYSASKRVCSFVHAGVSNLPLRYLLHGPPGTGKTTLGEQEPHPIKEELTSSYRCRKQAPTEYVLRKPRCRWVSFNA
jgi:hypothetical protein